MNEMKNIMLVLEYDGTRYSGWQSQQNAISVCDEVSRTINSLTGEDVQLTGCSRTDAGVHALNYVCNFMTESNIPPEKYSPALNTKLPSDISCKLSKQVPDSFHSRYCALSKRYLYMIQNTPFKPAVNRNHICWYPVRLNEELMSQAVANFIGRHDFSAFMASGSSIKNTIRTVFELAVVRNDDVIEIDIKGDGFLYNMVRIIAGTLMDVGIGRITPEYTAEIIASGDRKKAGRTAAASGLFLVEIEY